MSAVAESEPDRGATRDRGSVLPIVLVMIVIGALWAIPVLSYTTTVLRANTALSSKTQRIEAVKSGLRVALADPVSVYDVCGPGVTTLASTNANGVSVTTRCEVIAAEFAQSSSELRMGITATQVGQSAPADLTGDQFVPTDPTSPSEWYSDATVTSETDKVWLPDLPVHALNIRSADGHQMPVGYPSCTVYFPGTYTDPLELDGPTFFTSGVYYFESEVTVVGGGDVVVGDGAIPGCTSDQEAAFYAENAPSTHNIGGLGATFVFGHEGRLIVDNSNGNAPSIQVNRRYVAPEDTGTLPSADVSIVSVNGKLDVDGVTGIALEIPGSLEVPGSVVGDEVLTNATAQDYLPSVHTPEPKAPDQVVNVTPQPFNGAVLVTWDVADDNGSPIESYTVEASSGDTCTTQGSTACIVTGLANGSSVGFTVVATNAIGDSEPSDEAGPVQPQSTLSSLAAPSQPAAPTATPYEDSALVEWTAASAGFPITSYTVTAYDILGAPVGETCTVEMDVAVEPDLQCVIENLSPLEVTGYVFDVVATNAIGDSPASPVSLPTIVAVGLGDPPEPPPPPAPGPYVPPAILDIEVADPAPATVFIPGYISVPQGRIHVENPLGHSGVEIKGGILAAQYDISDGRAAGPQTVDIGFIPLVVQRKVRLTSTTSAGRESSVAIVQINQNGAYAVNSWQVQ